MAYDAMRLAPAGQNAWTLAVLLTALTVASSIIVALYRRGSLQLQAPRDSRSAAAKEGDRQPARQPRTTIRPYTTTELLRAASVALRSGDAAQARCESSAASSRQGRYTPGPAAGPATGLSEDSTSNTSLLSLGSVPRPVQEDFNRSDAWPSEVGSTTGNPAASWDTRKLLASNVAKEDGPEDAARLPQEAVRADVLDGEGEYTWPNGAEYYGEWKDGMADGRGSYVWATGDQYEGVWKDGLENGTGTSTAADGASFYGFWVDGRMHGEGVYKPATAENGRAEVMFLRHYSHGTLQKETVLRVAEQDLRRQELKDKPKMRRAEKHAAVQEQAKEVRPGETIYKGHHSYDLMRQLQLGILFSIAKTPELRSQMQAAGQPSPCDFKYQINQAFPKGQQSNVSFKWRDYSPAVFQHLREIFGLESHDYLLSLAGDRALRCMPSPGKSGSVFYLSDDDRFMIKSLRGEEVAALLAMLPKYYAHCRASPSTLLTRFLGLHRVKPATGSTVQNASFAAEHGPVKAWVMGLPVNQVSFVVMGNVFPNDVPLHRKYDLKGSTYGRTSGKELCSPGAMLKDLDVDMKLQLSPAAHRGLLQQIAADVALLERCHVMDYSMLLGVQFKAWKPGEWRPPNPPACRRQRGDQHTPKPVDILDPKQKWAPGLMAGKVTTSLHPGHRRTRKQAAAQAQDAWEAQNSPPGASASEVSMGVGQAGEQTSSESQALQDRRRSHPEAGPLTPSELELVTRSKLGPEKSVEWEKAYAQDLLSTRQTSVSSLALTLEPGPVTLVTSAPKLEPVLSPFAGFAARGEAAGDSDGTATPLHRRGVSFALDTPTRGSQELTLPSHTRHKSPPRRSVDPGGPPADLLGRSSSGWRRSGHQLQRLHSIAQPQLGAAMPAQALFEPEEEGELQREDVLLFFGIIDFLQDYNLRKRSEHLFKRLVVDGRSISVVHPETYAQRFMAFFQDLFITKP